MPKQSFKRIVHACILFLLILCLAAQPAPARAQTPVSIVVNSTGDDPDVGTGLPCETAAGNGVCTLRGAIKVANDLQSPGGTVITFDIDHSIPAAPTSISIGSALPVLQAAGTTIQGPNLHDSSVLVLDGNQGTYHGLDIRANNCTIKKLTIANFSGGESFGISVGSTSIAPVTGALIVGNTIGDMVPMSITDRPNYGGIKLENTLSSVIGGDTAADRNVISGNSEYGVYITDSATNAVRGNYIGVKSDGSTALSNEYGVVVVDSSGNTIGGNTAGRRNVISGNGYGIYVRGDSNVVQGNYIGTDVSGMVAVPNGYGIFVESYQNDYAENLIGGAGPGEGNLISGNSVSGIGLSNSNQTTIHGNTIGLNAAKIAALPNYYGISATSSGNDLIGGLVAGAGNVIAGNTSFGIALFNCVSTSIRGNFIGVNSSGQAFPNESGGIGLEETAGIEIGGVNEADQNTIAHNGGNGISISTAYAKVMGNQIYGNSGLGIDVWTNTGEKGVTPNDPDDSDNVQNFPVITNVSFPSVGRVLLEAEVPTLVSEELKVSFFASDTCDPSGYGEGQVYLGNTEVVAVGGLAEIEINLPLPGQFMYFTAIAWGASKSQSEFSACYSAIPPNYIFLPAILR
ncbi:MAG: hypothetical protein ABFD17_01950 [Anaerolineaceae bacterium]